MSLTALGGLPIVPVGAAALGISGTLAALGSILQDAANEACIMYGRLYWEDGGSHTVDTTGSSSLGWRSGAVTLANAGTTFKVGLADMDTGTGPAGRAVNVADVITFDVSGSYTSAGAPTASAWNEKVPGSGSKTIASGARVAFATQMTARGGADAVNTQLAAPASPGPLPGVTTFTGGSYADGQRLPNCVITASDGTLGFFVGGYVALTGSTTQTWNNTSSPSEYGNFLQFPVPVTVYGIYATGVQITGDANFVLYTAPLAAGAASAASISEDANAVSSSGTSLYEGYFTSPVSLAANQPCAAIMTPTSATNVSLRYKTFNAATHQKGETLGANCYAVSRSGGSGAFAAVNSNKDRFAIGLLIGKVDSGHSMLINSGELVG